MKIEKRKCLPEFTLKGHKFKMIGHNHELNIYLYERRLADDLVYYEVFKGRNTGTKENPIYDGYPSDNMFGNNALCINGTELGKQKAENILKNGF